MREFIPNPAGIKQVPKMQSQKDWAQRVSDAMTAEAKRLAPVLTGAYRDSLQGGPVKESVGWCAETKATDWKALLVEFGVHGIKKSRVLGKSLDAVGAKTTATVQLRRGRR